MRHLLDRLHGNTASSSSTSIHCGSLIRLRPEMIADRLVAQELAARVERLLNESLVAAGSQKELDARRYAVAITRRY